jgi:hypothetical protein
MDTGTATNLVPAGTARTPGKAEQRSADHEGPDEADEWVNVQRCLPAKRQHAGRLDSTSFASTAGLIDKKPKSNASKAAMPRVMLKAEPKTLKSTVHPN